MKVVLDHTTRKEIIDSKKNFAERFERILLKTAVLALFILIAVQAALFNPIFRSTFRNDHLLEGNALGREAYFFTPCKMELKLTNIDNCPDLEVLVNGEKRASFEQNAVLLELKEGDVVELDAGSLLVEATVQISAVSSNISNLLSKTMTITDGIERVALLKPIHK